MAIKLPEHDESDLQQFITSEHKTIKRHLRMYILNWGLAYGAAVDDEVDSLLSDLVYEALRSQHRYDSERPPLAWLLGIAVNLIRRRLSGNARQREIPLSDIQPDSYLSPSEIFERYLPGTKDANLENLENLEIWNKYLDTLSDVDKSIVNAKYRDGQKSDEIASDLNMKPATVRKRLSRILEQLRKQGGRDK